MKDEISAKSIAGAIIAAPQVPRLKPNFYPNKTIRRAEAVRAQNRRDKLREGV